MFQLYRIITLILSPLIYVYLLIRKKKGKEDSSRFGERLGKVGIPRPEGYVIWIHAASVGESVSMLPMMNAIVEQYEDVSLLLTTGTVTSAQLVEGRLPDRAYHQYVPIDVVPFIARFLKHWQPDMAIWVESEFWPNLVTQTSKYCPMILMNARISDDSYQKWQGFFHKPIAKEMLECFALTLPQNKEYGEKLEELGATNVKFVGNLKFDSPSLPSSPKEMGELVTMIGERKVWVAASTHPGEEEMIREVHLTLKANHPDLLTIIVPRHAKRGKDIANSIAGDEIGIKLRSNDDVVDAKTDIYIADTMGELGIFYRLASIVFIGGSLVEHGGQNPLEAARLECAIIFGPHMYNFKEVIKELHEANACIQINDKAELASTLEQLLDDDNKQEELAKASKSIVANKTGLLSIAMREITPFIEAIKSSNPTGS